VNTLVKRSYKVLVMLNIEKHWIAVYTRPRWEKQVAKTLTSKKFENYCPLNKVIRQWSDRKKLVYEPLIKSYVFIRASAPEYSVIKQIDGILNLVYWLGKPAIIKDKEIETLKCFLNDYHNVQLEKIDVNINDEVKIIYGPLFSMEGKVIEVQCNHVKIILPSLGYSLVAQVSKLHIEKVKSHRLDISSDNIYPKLSPL
jgi:transcription antitermination factor NusG